MQVNEIKHIDYSHLEGGLVRMMNRFKREGTLIGDPESDDFIRNDSTAALLGLLFDQRVLAEYAFTGPIRLKERLGHLDLNKIARMKLDDLRALFGEKPAVHRFTNRMAEYTLKLAVYMSENYDGDVTRLWSDGADFATVEKRARALPGFGEQKAEKLKYVLHYFGYRDFSDE
ncbi:MAG: hypothetical protein WD275_08275 [Rhodothermales bacterium]